MTKKTLAFVILLLAVLLGAGAPLRGQQGITIQRDITVAAGESQDNVFTIGGHAIIDGKVRHNAIAIGGTITVSGEVGESVVGFGARVVIKSTAVVRRDVVALGGTLEKEPGCTIQGDTVDLKGSEIVEKMFGRNFVGDVLSLRFIPLILILKLFVFIGWLVMALLGAALFPKSIAFAAEELRKSFWLAFAIGLLAHIVFLGLVIFAALLCIILIGIPLLLALVAAAVIIKIFGRLVVFYVFGQSLLRALGSRNFSPIGAVLMGLLVVTLVGFVPVVGFFFGIVINMAGWGIAIRTKFGTTENMFQRPLPPAPATPAA